VEKGRAVCHSPPDFSFRLESIDDTYSLVEKVCKDDDRDKCLASLVKVIDALYNNEMHFEDDHLEETIYFVIWCDYLSFQSTAYKNALRRLATHFHLVASIALWPFGGWKQDLFTYCVKTIGPRHKTLDFPESYWGRMTLDMMLVFLEAFYLFYLDDLDFSRLIIRLTTLWLDRGHPKFAQTIVDTVRGYIRLETLTEDELVGLIDHCKAMKVKPFVDDDLKTTLHNKSKHRAAVRDGKPLDSVFVHRMFHLKKDMGRGETKVTHFAGSMFSLIYVVPQDVSNDNLKLFLCVTRCGDAAMGACPWCGYGRWDTKANVHVEYSLDIFDMGCARRFPYNHVFRLAWGKATWGSKTFQEQSKAPPRIYRWF